MQDRILTTHVGSLPRPESLLAIMQDKAAGLPYDAAKLEDELATSVIEIVRKQAEAGIDLVSDGELSKPSYATYVTDRLTGFDGVNKMLIPADLREFREFSAHLVEIGGIVPSNTGSCCRGPVAVKDSSDLEADLRMMRAAVEQIKPVGAFISSASPGVVAIFQRNEFYSTDEEYVEAVAEAMRAEYEAIVDAGFILQIDCPDLAMGYHFAFANETHEAFLKVIDRNVEALNHAIRNIPAEKVRMHLCWGNYEGPHNHDIPFEKIASHVLRANPKFLLLEGANPRHGHEFAVFETVKLPEDKVVVPGVVDSTSNFIEHPDVIANRILNYANIVGRDRVMAGSDCGFSTFSGFPTVHPQIVWRKLESMVEGARRASAKLWAKTVV